MDNLQKLVGVEVASRLRNTQQSIERTYGAQYQLNDAGHREEHFRGVFATGVEILLCVGETSVVVVEGLLLMAYFHDLLAWSRENHEIISGAWIRTTKDAHVLSWLERGGDREQLARACERHRASYKGTLETFFERLCSSADRGRPMELHSPGGWVDRCIAYRCTKPSYAGCSRREMAWDITRHLEEKFSSTGYVRYDELYTMTFGTTMERLRAEVDAVVNDKELFVDRVLREKDHVFTKYGR